MTSSPSRIHTAPSANTTNQCQRANGNRSSLAGTSVSTALSEAVRGGPQEPATLITRAFPANPVAQTHHDASSQRCGIAGAHDDIAVFQTTQPVIFATFRSALAKAPTQVPMIVRRAAKVFVPHLQRHKSCAPTNGLTALGRKLPVRRHRSPSASRTQAIDSRGLSGSNARTDNSATLAAAWFGSTGLDRSTMSVRVCEIRVTRALYAASRLGHGGSRSGPRAAGAGFRASRLTSVQPDANTRNEARAQPTPMVDAKGARRHGPRWGFVRRRMRESSLGTLNQAKGMTWQN